MLGISLKKELFLAKTTPQADFQFAVVQLLMR